MNEREFARRMAKAFTPEVVARGLRAHVKASKAVYARREAELNAVGLSQKMPSGTTRKPAAMATANKRKK